MENHFGFLDYVAVAGTLILSSLIGVYFARKNETNDDLLLGGRKISSWPVAASIMASYISAVTVIGYPAEIYAYGIEIFQMKWAQMIAFVLSVYLFLPFLYHMKLTSIFEYVESRFGSKGLRKMAAGVYLFEQVVLAGVILYGPSLVLVTFLGIPNWLSIFGVGILSTMYTSVGGIKAVVWTDAFQSIMMLLGMFAILAQTFVNAGGVSKAFEIASDNGRINLFKMKWDIFQRHNFFNFFVGHTFMMLFRSTFHQQQVQRFSSQPTLKESRKAMLRSLLISFTVMLIGVLTGIGLFANYYNCDPIKLKQVKSMDHLVPYFVVNEMASIPGMMGLFTACIFSGVLSSISSTINSLTAVIWKDFLSEVPRFAKLDSKGQANVSRITGLVVGFVSVLLGFSAQYMGSVYTASFQSTGATCGVTSGLFLAAAFMPFINATGAKAGIICSLLPMLIIGSRSIFSKVLKEPMLPTSIENCPANLISAIGNETSAITTENYIIEWPEKIFTLSYLMYPIVGGAIFILVASIASLLTGGFGKEQRNSIQNEYLHPFVRRKVKVESENSADRNIRESKI